MIKRLLILILSTLFVPILAMAQNKADLSWEAPSYSSPDVLTYGVYQGTRGQMTKTKIATTAVGVLTYSVTGLATGGEVCWNVTAITPDGKESGYSNEACKPFPWALPGAPVGLTAD